MYLYIVFLNIKFQVYNYYLYILRTLFNWDEFAVYIMVPEGNFTTALK